MRLKEIKPGMAIHCKNDEEKSFILEEAERLGYVWYRTKRKPTERNVTNTGNTIHFYDAGTNHVSADYKHITHSCETGDYVTEFSDLILPELTAEEALSIISEMCRNKTCEECYLGAYCDHANSACSIQLMKPDVVIDACIKWKSDHEKKEPEIETVDICRIIEIKTDGKKRCVHEIDLNPDGEMLFKEQIEEILKRYCMEHEGEFIAVHEVVSRVKK